MSLKLEKVLNNVSWKIVSSLLDKHKQKLFHRFFEIYNKQEVFLELLRETYVKQLIVKSPEGLFAFDYTDEVVGKYIAFYGAWEETESGLIKKIVKSDDIVVDIGANLGWYTVLCSNLVGRQGFVIAFEPEPRNYQLLQTNIFLNKLENVKAHQIALLDSKSTVEFELSESNFGDHRVRFTNLIDAPIEKYAESSRSVISVAACTLDEAMEEHIKYLGERTIKLIKIDCQGSEIAILRGAKRTLSKTDYLISEYWPYGIRRAGFESAEFLEIIEENFTSFSRVQESAYTDAFKPISMLVEDLQRVSTSIDSVEFTDYIFKK